jgi:alpha-glucoside transport system permease protein
MTFENYRNLVDNQGMVDAIITTIWITIGATILPILLAALAGYAFAWLEFPGRDWIFLGVIALLLVPVQMALIPVFTLYNNLSLYDTIPGLILFHTAFALPFAIFLLRNFFAGIPRDLMEAARIDGASELRIFFRLILPLGLPAVASLGIFQVLFVWNDLLVGLVLAQNNQPIAPEIASQLRQFAANLEVIAPASFFSAVIPLAIFLAFQRYFVQGLLAGSVK